MLGNSSGFQDQFVDDIENGGDQAHHAVQMIHTGYNYGNNPLTQFGGWALEVSNSIGNNFKFSNNDLNLNNVAFSIGNEISNYNSQGLGRAGGIAYQNVGDKVGTNLRDNLCRKPLGSQ